MAGNPESMTFIPGEDPGDFALGLPNHPSDLSRLAAYKLRMAKMPTGYNVAEKFPWWRKVHEVLRAEDKIVLLRPGWQATFENASDHDVEVDEIRFYMTWSRPTPDYRTRLLCKIGIPPRREIIADWIPVHSLHTENDRILIADMDAFTYELPAPYVLQRGNQFAMDWRFNAAFLTNMAIDDWVIEVGLHGWGLQDYEPISLMKPVRGWPQPTGAVNQWQTIAFEEEQDRPMRDAVITHISFGAALTTNVNPNVFEALEFRPHAPEGPDWHQGEFFAVRDVAEQVGRVRGGGAGMADCFVIHRPIVPYVLGRGEGMLVELWNHDVIAEVAADVILRGSQTGRRA